MNTYLRALLFPSVSFWMWLGLPFLSALAEEGPRITEAEARAVVAPLGVALRGLGAFQAEYRTVSPTQTTNVTLIHNPEIRYTLVMLNGVEPKNSRLITLLEYGGEDKGFGEVRMTYGEPPRLTRMRVSIEEEMRNVASPLGSMLFMAEQYWIATRKANGLERIKQPAPFLNLGIVDHRFQMALGVVSTSEGLNASWLSHNWVQTAERIDQTDETVTLDFPGGKRVTLQRSTGLLAQEHWPDNPEEFPESITLLQHKPLDNTLGFAELIPGLDTFEILEAPPNPLVSMFYLSLYLDINRMIEEQGNFQDNLEKYAARMAASVTSEGRIRLRDTARQMVARNPQQNRISEVFQENFQKFSKAQPDVARELGFEGFLKAFLMFAEQNPDQKVIPPLEQLLTQIQRGIEQSLEAMPDAKNEAVKKLHQRLLPPLMNAWRLELLSATLEHAQSYKKEE